MSDLSVLGEPRARLLLAVPESSSSPAAPRRLASSRGLAVWPGAPSLEVLDLSGHALTSLSGLGGAALPRLRLLALAGNSLAARALAAAPPLAPGLLGLVLAGNAQLRDVGAPGGAPLPDLRWLDASHCPLEALVRASGRARQEEGGGGAGMGWCSARTRPEGVRA